MISGWTFQEMQSAGQEHLDPEKVASYDARAQFDPEPDVALLKALGLTGESTVLDLGAGTGTFALRAAPECQHVTLVDPSRPMLTAAAQKAEAQGLHNLTFLEGGFLSFRLQRPVDFIFCRNALHHLPDFWKVEALRRLRAALKPGGVLRLKDLTFSFPPAEAGERITRWLDNAERSAAGGYTREDLEAHVREEFSTFTWLLEPMLERTGFRVEHTEYSPSGIFAAYVCRAV